MKVVIDTNVLMAGLLKDSIVRIVLLSKGHSFFLPEHALDEIKKYEEELLKKSGCNRRELKILMNHLLKNVKLVKNESLKVHIKRAETIMKDIDIKDSSFIAAALAIKADGIWSYDPHFREQSQVRVININDLFK